MNALDKRILSALAQDARIGVSALARGFGLARSTIQARIERLEARGIITGYTVKLGDAVRLGRIRASVLLQVEPRTTAAVVARLKSIHEVEIIHTCSGRFDMILDLAAETTTRMDEVLDEIGSIRGVRSSESLIHLSTKFDRSL
ncbi:MAG: Lrp/AsnC family transcriptional regulator [Paracoccaceae bacterium]